MGVRRDRDLTEGKGQRDGEGLTCARVKGKDKNEF